MVLKSFSAKYIGKETKVCSVINLSLKVQPIEVLWWCKISDQLLIFTHLTEFLNALLKNKKKIEIFLCNKNFKHHLVPVKKTWRRKTQIGPNSRPKT